MAVLRRGPALPHALARPPRDALWHLACQAAQAGVAARTERGWESPRKHVDRPDAWLIRLPLAARPSSLVVRAICGYAIPKLRHNKHPSSKCTRLPR